MGAKAPFSRREHRSRCTHYIDRSLDNLDYIVVRVFVTVEMEKLDVLFIFQFAEVLFIQDGNFNATSIKMETSFLIRL